MMSANVLSRIGAATMTTTNLHRDGTSSQIRDNDE